MTTGNGGKAVDITPEGGAVKWVENQTGEVSVKGKAVCPSQTTDYAVELVAVDEADINGYIYDAGVPVGEMMRIVFSGWGHALFVGATTRHHFCRMTQAADSGAAAGLVISEALPTPPFSTDKHFQEGGHVYESVAGPGPVLALINMHFN